MCRHPAYYTRTCSAGRAAQLRLAGKRRASSSVCPVQHTYLCTRPAHMPARESRPAAKCGSQAGEQPCRPHPRHSWRVARHLLTPYSAPPGLGRTYPPGPAAAPPWSALLLAMRCDARPSHSPSCVQSAQLNQIQCDQPLVHHHHDHHHPHQCGKASRSNSARR